jgi:hypothetical protein
MKHLCNKALIIALLAFVSFFSAKSALADINEAGDVIENLATLNFTIGGDPQLLESSAAGNSTIGASQGLATSFAVDRKIDLSITNTNAIAIKAVAREQSVVLEFTVVNETNDVMNYILAAEVDGTDVSDSNTNVGTLPSGVELTDLNTSFEIYLEDDGVAGFSTGDTLATSITGLKSTQTALDDGDNSDEQVVYVVVDLDDSANPNQFDYLFVTLIARAADGSGALITSDSNGFDANNGPAGSNTLDNATEQDVFADGSSALAANNSASTVFEANDKTRNGQLSATGYIVIDTGLEVTKTLTTIWDPLATNNDLSDDTAFTPKAIPGAYVQYQIVIENTATNATFNLTSIADVVDSINASIDEGLLNAVSCSTALAAATISSPSIPDDAQTYSPDDCFSLDFPTSATYGDGDSVLQVEYVDDSDSDAVANKFYTLASTEISAVTDLTKLTITIDLADILTSTNYNASTDPDFDNDGDLEAGDKVTLTYNLILQ